MVLLQPQGMRALRRADQPLPAREPLRCVRSSVAEQLEGIQRLAAPLGAGNCGRASGDTEEVMLIGTSQAICDGCGAAKRETNHWFLLFIRSAEKIQYVAISEWSQPDAEEANAFACGEACSHKLVSRWFETRTFDPPALRSVSAAAYSAALRGTQEMK
jgi:hypothetical protein